jgi:hypothetical protein
VNLSPAIADVPMSKMQAAIINTFDDLILHMFTPSPAFAKKVRSSLCVFLTDACVSRHDKIRLLQGIGETIFMSPEPVPPSPCGAFA